MLRKRDAGTGKIKFVDIASDSYDPSENAGIDFEAAMGRIHGIQRDGTIVTNVEVCAPSYHSQVLLQSAVFLCKYRRVSRTLSLGFCRTLNVSRWKSCAAAETSNLKALEQNNPPVRSDHWEVLRGSLKSHTANAGRSICAVF